MSFFSIFLALVIEQARPLGSSHFLHQWLRRWADWVASHVDGGTRSQAWLAWGLLIGAPACLAVLIHWCLAFFLGWFFAVVWNVGLLYVTLGFRQFSHHFTGIRDALNDGDEPLARELLANWQQIEINDLPRNEIVRHVIEHSVLSAHRHVFGVFFSYALLSIVGLGPVGAVVYRIAEFAKRYWSQAPSIPAATATTPTHQDSGNWHSESMDRWHRLAKLLEPLPALTANMQEKLDAVAVEVRNYGVAGDKPTKTKYIERIYNEARRAIRAGLVPTHQEFLVLLAPHFHELPDALVTLVRF